MPTISPVPWQKVCQLLVYSKVYSSKHCFNVIEERNTQSKAKHTVPRVHEVLPYEHQPSGTDTGESAAATKYI